MKTTTQKELRQMIANGTAEELIECNYKLHHDLHTVAESYGMYGLNGLLLEDRTTGHIYAIPDRNSMLFFYAM